MLIDSHVHVFPKSFEESRNHLIKKDSTFREMYTNSKSTLSTSENLLHSMDVNNIDFSIITSIGWENYEIAKEANNYLLNSAKKHSDRLGALVGINPNWGDLAIEEIKRCIDQGAIGLGEMHPDTQKFKLNDSKLLSPLMNLAKKNNLIMLMHSSEPLGRKYPGKGKVEPKKILAFSKLFPENKIIASHWGGGLTFYYLLKELKSSPPKLYFDTAATNLLYSKEIFEIIINIIGADNILFGSDFPLVKQEKIITLIKDSKISKIAKSKLLGENAKQLLKISKI